MRARVYEVIHGTPPEEVALNGYDDDRDGAIDEGDACGCTPTCAGALRSIR